MSYAAIPTVAPFFALFTKVESGLYYINTNGKYQKKLKSINQCKYVFMSNIETKISGIYPRVFVNNVPSNPSLNIVDVPVKRVTSLNIF